MEQSRPMAIVPMAFWPQSVGGGGGMGEQRYPARYLAPAAITMGFGVMEAPVVWER